MMSCYAATDMQVGVEDIKTTHSNCAALKLFNIIYYAEQIYINSTRALGLGV